MKKTSTLLATAAGILFGLISMTSQAATATGTFNVNINLTSACAVNTTATAATFNYTSLQAAASTFSTAFNVQCTNTLPIVSVALDSTAVIDTATNLSYTLALVGAPATATGVPQAVTVNGTMAAGQAGTCATATCTNALSPNKTRTVTITY